MQGWEHFQETAQWNARCTRWWSQIPHCSWRWLYLTKLRKRRGSWTKRLLLAFKGAGNTFIKLPAVAINASIKNYFEIIVWHLTPRRIIIFMGSDPGKIISSPKFIFAWFDLCRKQMVLAWNPKLFLKNYFGTSPPPWNNFAEVAVIKKHTKKNTKNQHHQLPGHSKTFAWWPSRPCSVP